MTAKILPQRTPKRNKWWEHEGHICFDASTPKFPGITGRISREDLHLLTDGRGKWVAWSPRKAIYIVRRCEGKVVYMHREILSPDSGVQVDHISGDASDNRRENMRLVSDRVNKRNMPRPKTNTSGFCGVRWDAKINRYLAQIGVDGKGIFLGYFDSLDEACAERKKAEARFGFHANHGRGQDEQRVS